VILLSKIEGRAVQTPSVKSDKITLTDCFMLFLTFCLFFCSVGVVIVISIIPGPIAKLNNYNTRKIL
jgi:hypothetical protein